MTLWSSGLAVIVLFSGVFLSSASATSLGLRHLFLDTMQTSAPKASQGKSGASSGSPSAKKKGTLRLSGTLVKGGVECQRFRDSNGKFYTLVGDLRGFHVGDTVEIRGRIPRASHCMQDTTIEVETIQRAKSPASPTNRKPKAPPPHRGTISMRVFKSDLA